MSMTPIDLNDSTALEPRANRLLAALGDEELQTWTSLLTATRLQRGQVLRSDVAYFPTTATVSLFAGTRAGDSTEVATVGNEGFVGVGLVGGSEPARDRAEVTQTGHAFAMPGAALRGELLRSSATMELVLRYLQVHMAQMVQRAVCVQHHSTKQRLCCCLLDSLDRSHWRTTLELTHDSMAARLGVRRETVTACAQQLKSEGIMSYQRGSITLHDVAALRATSCPCHDEMRSLLDRLLPPARALRRAGPPLRVPEPAPAAARPVLREGLARVAPALPELEVGVLAAREGVRRSPAWVRP